MASQVITAKYNGIVYSLEVGGNAVLNWKMGDLI